MKLPLLIMSFLIFLACGPLDKPVPIKTHLRNMIIVPEMIGSQLAVYNGKVFNQIEVKPEMVGHYLGEFSISYR
jgi:small subunit ribosomal protein S15e